MLIRKIKRALSTEKNVTMQYTLPDTDAVLQYRMLKSRKSNKPYVIIDGVSGVIEKLDIPKSIDKVTVRYISNAAFKNNTDLKEVILPNSIKKLRKETFAGCSRLKKARLPEKLDSIDEMCFQNCEALHEVVMGDTLKEIGTQAFANCVSLKHVKLPAEIENIGQDAFFDNTILWCDASLAEKMKDSKLNTKVFSLDYAFAESMMIPREDDKVPAAFYDEDQLIAAECYYENVCVKPEDRVERRNLGEFSRFILRDGTYILANQEHKQKNEAKLVLTGSLHSGEWEMWPKSYFDGVKDILRDADLTVGTFAAYHLPTEETIEQLNLSGFDLLVHADNRGHMQNIRKVMEHIDCMNRGQLMHVGLYGGKKDKRFVITDLQGIHVAVLSYVNEPDEERTAKDEFFACRDFTQLKSDIEAAKTAGAEFILVYANCKLSEQEKCFNMIADAGADYIFGCSSKKIHPYNIVISADQRKVPVIYGGGTFAGEEGPGIMVELKLEKDDFGCVKLAEEHCHPCRVTDRIVKIDRQLKCADVEERIGLEETLFSIRTNLGINARMQYELDLDADLAKMLIEPEDELQKCYGVQPGLVAKKHQTVHPKQKNDYHYNSSKGCYHRMDNEGEREAHLLCVGQIEYNKDIETDAECFGEYDFLKSFKIVAEKFEDADFVVGNLATMASIEYPSMSEVSPDAIKRGYKNCRMEWIKALKCAGFTGIAAANTFNAGLGLEGILDTERQLMENGLISSGIGEHKHSVIEINGIKIGLVSVTTDCINKKRMLTGEAIAKYLNIYDANQTLSEIEAVKAAGAEFVLVYVYCGLGKNTMTEELRRDVAEEIAEMGADYVICTEARTISAYERYETKDHRIVPITTSLGSFITGRKSEEGFDGAMLSLFIRRKFDGTIEVEDNYIPIQILNQYEGISHAVLPVHDEKTSIVGELLGKQIQTNKERLVKISDPYTKTLTIEEIYQVLNKKPSKKDLAAFGDRYHQQVSCVALRKRYMKEGGVAVMYKYGNFGEEEPITWNIEECIEAGVSLVIDQEPHDELPCIVVEEPLMDVFAKLSKTVRDWYNPVTVAITGSMGKTTTKELTTKVFETQYRTLCAQGNNNAIYQIGQIVQKLEDDDEAYIQEVHGGTQNMASCISNVIRPDICIITNVVKNHMSQIGTIENLVQNKLGIIDGLKEDGVLIICNDNEYLRAVNPPVKTIRYSMFDTACDYYAQNIKTEGDEVSFEIVSKGSEFDEPGIYAAKINTRGEHNVSNALAAFAAGRQAGIDPHKIIVGLSRYRTTGIRQNVFDHGGITMLMDTYNSNPKALMAMFDVFDQLQPKEDGRKILILGMMGEQGDDSPQIHYDTGKAICEHPFDLMFCFGEDARYMVQAVKECGKKAYYFEDRDVFNRMISAHVRPGDVVMVKGSHSVKLDTDTMVPVFGKIIRKY